MAKRVKDAARTMPKIPPKPEPLYPDRVEVFCLKCRAIHWRPGRCFFNDPVFRRVIGIPVGRGKRLKTDDLPPLEPMPSFADVVAGKAPPRVSDEKRAKIIEERMASWERDAAHS
jgi:hypothetical protein